MLVVGGDSTHSLFMCQLQISTQLFTLNMYALSNERCYININLYIVRGNSIFCDYFHIYRYILIIKTWNFAILYKAVLTFPPRGRCAEIARLYQQRLKKATQFLRDGFAIFCSFLEIGNWGGGGTRETGCGVDCASDTKHVCQCSELHPHRRRMQWGVPGERWRAPGLGTQMR